MLNKKFGVVKLTPVMQVAGIRENDILKVEETKLHCGYSSGLKTHQYIGAVKVENISQGKSMHNLPNLAWCFFTETMVDEGYLVEVAE